MESFEQQDVSNRVTHNGFGLAESEEFEIQMLEFMIMLNKIPNAQTYDSAPLLPNQ